MNKIENETEPFLVIHKASGVTYKLFPKGNETYYLASVDGVGGQTITRTAAELNEMFSRK